MFDALVAKHSDEIANLRSGNKDDMSDDLFQDFFDHYCNNGEMPYGTAKARTGDPHQWIYYRLIENVK